MKELTEKQLYAGMNALHTCLEQQRPNNFTVTLIYKAIQEAELEPAPVNDANPVTDNEVHE